MARVVVVGDVGGHPAELHVGLALVAAGGELPAGTVVVQVGDLVDRGPDSAGVLAAVRGYLERQPDQWVQLIGNHEGQYLPGGDAFWPQRLADDGIELLRGWWEQRRMRVATAVRRADGEEFLLTHAGLTVPVWDDLGRPATAADAARRLNQRPEWLLNRGGVSDASGRGAGPLWAEAGWDLYEPWLRRHDEGEPVPFGQIHGHASIVSYTTRQWRCNEQVQSRATVDWANRHTRVRIGGRVFIGVDPKHGRTGAPSWRPLVLDDTMILSDQPAVT